MKASVLQGLYFLFIGKPSEILRWAFIFVFQAFLLWAGERKLTKELTAGWKERLVQRGYAAVTVNSMLSALNGILDFLGHAECQAKFIRIQRKMFGEQEWELSREEYEKLLSAARRKGKLRLELLLETICATGIRVSEVRHMTVEAAQQGRDEKALRRGSSGTHQGISS